MTDKQMSDLTAAMEHLVDAYMLLGVAGSFNVVEGHPLTVARRAISEAQHQLALAQEYILETRVSVKTTETP